VARSPILWFTLLAVAAVLFIVRLGIAYEASTNGPSSQANVQNGLLFALIVAASLLLLVGVWASLYRRGQARNAAIARDNPGAMLVVTSKSPGMASTIAALQPGTRIRTAAVWAIDHRGARLWQGGGNHPVEIFNLPKERVLSMRHDTINVGSRDIDAISFHVWNPSGYESQIQFMVRSAKNPVFPLGRDGVDKTIAAIEQIWRTA
jgi:hypothetical protein